MASEREAELEAKGMDRCTTIHSNLSMWAVSRKWFVAKLHPQNLLFSQLVQVTHFITSHRNIISRLLIRKSSIFPWLSISAVLCLNLESPLATRQFTKNTSQSLLEQSGSHGNHVIFWCKRRNCKKWLPEIDSVKHFSMWTGVLIGTVNAFLRQRFRFACQVQHHRHDYWKFVRKVTRGSCAVTFIAMETLNDVL